MSNYDDQIVCDYTVEINSYNLDSQIMGVHYDDLMDYSIKYYPLPVTRKVLYVSLEENLHIDPGWCRCHEI